MGILGYMADRMADRMADLSYNNNSVPSYLNDLFGDCFFTPEGEAIFLSEEADKDNIVASSETTPATVASRIIDDGSSVSVSMAGGIAATNLDKPGFPATVMGPATATSATTAPIPFVQAPQKENHIGFATLPASSSAT